MVRDVNEVNMDQVLVLSCRVVYKLEKLDTWLDHVRKKLVQACSLSNKPSFEQNFRLDK